MEPPVNYFLRGFKQPPQNDMKNYLDTLRRESSRQQAEASRLQKRCAKPPWEPLEVQIQRWWANAPETVKSRPFQLIEIAGVCSGRYQARPALRCVAQALRALGWREYRCWKRSGRNRRFWILSSPVKSSVGVD